MAHYTETVTQDLSFAVTDYIITENFSSLHDLILSYHSRPHINTISVTNPSGVVIATSQPERLGQSIDAVQLGKMDTASASFDFNTWTMQYLSPVRLAGTTVGWCQVTVNSEQLKNGLAALQQKAAIFGIVAWLLACVSAIIISAFIIRPVNRIMTVALEVSSGNFGRQTDVKGPQEIRQLAAAFNAMMGAIENRENLLRLSEKKFRSLVEDINDLVWEVDNNGVFTYVSPAVEQILGYKPDEVIGKTSFSFMTKDGAERVRNTLGKNVEKRSEFKCLINISLHKDGQEVVTETSGRPIIDEAGVFKGYRGVDRDITKRQQAEEALQAEKERLAVTLRSIGDGVITTDTEGRIVFLNKTAEDLTGWTTGEARGKPSTEIFNIINEKTDRKCVSPVQQVIKLGRIIDLANDTALIAKDGSVRSITDSGAPIRDKESEIIGVVIVFRDITHEKKIEEELLKVKKLESIAVLAGGIAHDFNNLLSAILGNIELAGYRIAEEDPKTVSLLSNARKATKRAAKLANQLLTFSKGGDPVREVTSLPEFIIESAKFVLHGSQVSCNYNFADHLWMVDVDSGQICQVIQNIILNAKHAMPEGGTVTIQGVNVQDPATEALLSVDEGDYVRITVQDTGIGIPKEIIDKIFDPYFTTKQEGSGLGLAICHSIIKKHDGYLIVDSIPGKGTTFTLYLPAVPTVDLTVAKQKAKPAVKAARILVMDDEEMLRDVAKAQLVALGHEPILVTDGFQAINRYQELQEIGMPVDLVIMDLTIPGGMGGQEAAARLLLIDPEAKIIVASGYSNDPAMANYKEYGFRAAVVKPFDLKELSNAIASVL